MDKDCTIYKTVDFIGKRWTVLILLELYKGKQNWKRYSEIKKCMGTITPKMLSERLKELESQKMIEKRIDSSQVPIKCEYSLTNSGLDFIKIIKDIKKWALKWNIKNTVCANSNCKHCTL
ncbi:MAG: helix-turn-helix domain-containing protein [Nanoarchaeota archaeon]|nr:helix-turn-helix domain-containing protein [Nanoarchaeota archaeon]